MVGGDRRPIFPPKNNSIKTIKADLSNYSNYNSMLSSFDYVISAVPGFMGYKTLEAIINAKKNVVDISFFPRMHWNWM
ncbi:MAG: saccharopine dehydrogenase NADP-binding domain-containing protein [Chitinophagaceae bacterium]|nr:saccharopine dehydrogenase NADP-binding domain-containing protein [Chitinophagaceae bacterium]